MRSAELRVSSELLNLAKAATILSRRDDGHIGQQHRGRARMIHFDA